MHRGKTVGPRTFLDFAHKWRPGPKTWISDNNVDESILTESNPLNKKVTWPSIQSERADIGNGVAANVALSVD